MRYYREKPAKPRRNLTTRLETNNVVTPREQNLEYETTSRDQRWQEASNAKAVSSTYDGGRRMGVMTGASSSEIEFPSMNVAAGSRLS